MSNLRNPTRSPSRSPLMPATASFGGFNLIDAIRENGLATNLVLCLDAADKSSYTSGQSWLDRSGGGYDFFLGANGSATSTDPTFVGVPGGKSANEYFSFDGGDYFTYDTTNETWMENLHKDNAAFTILGYIYCADATSFSIFGTCGTSTNNAGCVLTVTSANRLQFIAGNGSGAALSVASENTAAGLLINGQWQFFGLSLNEATGAGGVAFYSRNHNSALLTSTYSSPAAGSANTTMQIAARGAGSSIMKASNRLGCIAMWSRALSAAEVAAFKYATQHRYSV